MITARGLHLSYEGTPVLAGLDLDVADSDTMVIVGRSGAGKTQLLKCLAGLVRPDAGSVTIDGVDLLSARGRSLAAVRRKIGMLLQEGALFDSMTVFENVAFPLAYHKRLDRGEIKARVEKYLELVELEDAARAFPQELSGGMRRKAALARAMIFEPTYLFYDEPTSGLDPASSGIVESMILKLSRERRITSLIVTHDIDLARYVGNRIALLTEGRITHVEQRELAFAQDSAIYEHFVRQRERMHTQSGG